MIKPGIVGIAGAVVLVGLLGYLGMGQRYWTKTVPGEIKVFAGDEELVVATDLMIMGWRGRRIEEWLVRGGSFLGFGSFGPTHERRELRMWHLAQARCRESIFPDRSAHAIFPVDDQLFFSQGEDLEVWDGQRLRPLSPTEKNQLESRFEYLRDAEKSSEWRVEEVLSSEPGKKDHRFGDYVVTAGYTEESAGAFYDDIVEVRVSTMAGEELCSLTESRAFWRSVTQEQFEELFSEDNRVPYPE